MGGYWSQILAILSINVVAGYAAYLPLSCGQLNLGVAGFMAIGAYASALLVGRGWPLLVCLPFAMVAAALVGLALSLPILRARGIYLTIATLAFSEAITALIINMDALGAASGLVVSDYMSAGPMLVTALAVTVGVVGLGATRFGLCLTAIRNDYRAAAVFGLNVRNMEVVAFTCGAALAGLAGALYAHHFNYIEAQQFNILLSTYAVLYALLGGLQTTIGPLVGAALFTLAPELLRGTSDWRYVGFGAFIIVLMTMRSEGLITRRSLQRCRDAVRPRRVVEA